MDIKACQEAEDGEDTEGHYQGASPSSRSSRRSSGESSSGFRDVFERARSACLGSLLPVWPEAAIHIINREIHIRAAQEASVTHGISLFVHEGEGSYMVV